MFQGIANFIQNYKYIVVPFGVWFGIQLFKLIYDLIVTKKFNFKRILQAGGMPSSHSAVVVALTTMIAKAQGINSPLFGVSLIFSFVVMYDAAGVRRAAGKQAKLLNKIVETPGLTGLQVSERLVEVLGHTPVQVFVGAFIGLIVGFIF
ncbi:MAG: divergent PAP2 family protein [Clostridia bacterium]|jgi:acid phosphatase family membrane protein YuiD|nr:divergent PAP2 family protein [Clostridia bacterium]